MENHCRNNVDMSFTIFLSGDDVSPSESVVSRLAARPEKFPAIVKRNKFGPVADAT